MLRIGKSIIEDDSKKSKSAVETGRGIEQGDARLKTGLVEIHRKEGDFTLAQVEKTAVIRSKIQLNQSS